MMLYDVTKSQLKVRLLISITFKMHNNQCKTLKDRKKNLKRNRSP